MAYIEIDKSNLIANIEKIRKITNREIMAVIKDNGYGHGIKEVASILKESGVERVAVRNNSEAEIVKPFFKEILVFFPTLNRNGINVSYTISDITSLKKCRHKRIHLKFDTGMHRNALPLENVDEILQLAFKKFEVKGVFSHFCCSDEFGNDTFIQLDRFLKLKKKVISFCKKYNYPIPKFHLPNSDAILKLKEFEEFDYVRPGIALYGGIEGFKPVMSLWGEKIKNYKIEEKQFIGYNKRYFFDKEKEITLIDLGYSDGVLYFDKELKLKETKAIGKISMDSMSVLGKWDKVLLFDDIKEFAKNYRYTITYDILTKLKPYIKRVIK